MSYAQAYRIAREQHEAAEVAYRDRVTRAGLAVLEDNDYASPSLWGLPYEPSSERAWTLHKRLREAEGALNEAELENITRGIRSIKIREGMNRILTQMTEQTELESAIPGYPSIGMNYLKTVAGQGELRLLAMQRLGLHEAREYGPLYSEVSRQKHFRGKSAERLYFDRPME